jgi:hypothetical protein
MRNSHHPRLLPIFAPEDVASYYSGLSVYTLKKYRESDRLTENLHWVKIPPRLVLYCLPLLLDWEFNADTPEKHLEKAAKFIEAFPLGLFSGLDLPEQKS